MLHRLIALPLVLIALVVLATDSSHIEVRAQAAVQPNEPSAKVFSEVVIADLPPVLSVFCEELADRFSALASAKLDPLWWRLDMAAFRVSPASSAEALSSTLGLKVVSDVSERLILAPALTPNAIKSEARLYIASIAEIAQSRGISKQASGAAGMTGIEEMLMNGLKIGMAEAGFDPDELIEEETGRGDENEKPLMSLSGLLNDPAVLAALHLTADDLSIPLKHYSVDDFSVKPIQGSEQGVQYSYNSFDMGMADDSSGIVISAREGLPQMELPEGPEVDLGLMGGGELGAMIGLISGNALVGLRAFGGMMMMNSRYYHGESEPESHQEEDSPFYVAMRLDAMGEIRTPDQGVLDQLAEKIEATEDAAAKRKLQLQFLTESDCTHAAKRKIWVDRTALDLMQDKQDDSAKIRVAKRAVVEKASTMLKEHAERQGAKADYPEGRMSDWKLRNAYGIGNQWNYFQIPPYDGSMFEIAAYQGDDAAAFKGHMSFGTTSGLDTEYAFAVRIDPTTGSYSWLHGEPESEDFIRGRHDEVRQGTELLLEALNQVLKQWASGASTELNLAELDADWVSDVFRAQEYTPKYTTFADYRILPVLPGIVRVQGESAGGATKQSVLVDVTTHNVIWETRRELPEVELDDDPYAYMR